jgi:hypothetical protein
MNLKYGYLLQRGPETKTNWPTDRRTDVASLLQLVCLPACIWLYNLSGDELTKQHMDEWRYSSTVVDHDTRERWVVRFKFQPLYPYENISSLVAIAQEAGWITELDLTFWRKDKSLDRARNLAPAVQR